MLRWTVYAIGGLVLLVGVIAVVGYLLPIGHVASREATFTTPRERVFATISDVARYGEWRPDVSRVEVISTAPTTRWKESGRNGDITFELEEVVPPTRIVARIADTSLPFGGTWTYELVPSGNGTRVTITERGEVYNPVFRFMSRFVLSQTATMEAFLEALGRRVG